MASGPIREITLKDVAAGLNWRLTRPHNDYEQSRPMEEWGGFEPATKFADSDTILYSALVAYPSGEVTALLQLKTVGEADYGGDYCEYLGGRWSQVGLTPAKDTPIGQEYVANPLLDDPSFDAPDHDYRAWHRKGFQEHVAKLTAGQPAPTSPIKSPATAKKCTACGADLPLPAKFCNKCGHRF